MSNMTRRRTAGLAVMGPLLALCGTATAQLAGTPPAEPPPAAPTENAQTASAQASSGPSRFSSITIDYDTVPFEGRDTGLALVPMVLEGGLRRFFLIDTGTTFSTVTDETAKALGLTPQPAVAPDGGPVAIDGKRADFVNISSVKSDGGKLDLHGQFAVMDNSALRIVPGMPQMGGVIGMNMLSQMNPLWDFAAHRLTLVLAAGLSDAEVKALGFAGPGVPMTQTPDNQLWYVGVSVSHGKASAQVSALLDTGAAQSYITRRLADVLGLRPDGPRVQRIMFTGRVISRKSIVNSLQVGDQRVSNATVFYPDRDAASEPPLLGLDVLSRYRVLMDFANRKMYLAPPTPAAPSVQVKPAAPGPALDVSAAKP